MKTAITLTAAALALSACAYEDQMSWLSCDNLSEIAAEGMSLRQTEGRHASLADAYAAIDASENLPNVKRVMRQIAKDAWAVDPVPEGEVENVIADFRDDVVAQCESRDGYPS